MVKVSYEESVSAPVENIVDKTKDDILVSYVDEYVNYYQDELSKIEDNIYAKLVGDKVIIEEYLDDKNAYIQSKLILFVDKNKYTVDTTYLIEELHKKAEEAYDKFLEEAKDKILEEYNTTEDDRLFAKWISMDMNVVYASQYRLLPWKVSEYMKPQKVLEDYKVEDVRDIIKSIESYEDFFDEFKKDAHEMTTTNEYVISFRILHKILEERGFYVNIRDLMCDTSIGKIVIKGLNIILPVKCKERPGYIKLEFSKKELEEFIKKITI